MTNEQIIDMLNTRLQYNAETSSLCAITALCDELTVENYFKKYNVFSTLLGPNIKVLNDIMIKSILTVVITIIERQNRDIETSYYLPKVVIHSWIDISDQIVSISNNDFVNYIASINNESGITTNTEFSFKYENYNESKMLAYITVLSDMGMQFVKLNNVSNNPSSAIKKTDGIYCNFKYFGTSLKESFDNAGINLETLSENMMIFDKDFTNDQMNESESIIQKFIEAFEKPFMIGVVRYLGFSEEVNTFSLNRIKIGVTYNKANDRFKNLMLTYNFVSPNLVHSELLPECSFKFKPFDVLSVLYMNNKQIDRKNEKLSADLVKFIMEFNKLILAIYKIGNDIKIN